MESSKLVLPGLEESVTPVVKDKTKNKTTRKTANSDQPPNLGKVTKLPVPDFDDPNRPRTCLEVDFPIAQINALSNLEGNAGKPIYQMSKWWARRRSSVFRSLLIAAALQAPEKDDEAAKLVWEHYYANHQKAGNFKNLKVLDPFMGGGTTLVEGARLGFHVFGVDLNPVAWFVVKNELAGTDPAAVQSFFEQIEAEVKPQLQPFYTTTGPNDEKGKWIDTRLNQVVDIDPINLQPEERAHYRYDGPEIIYTFWVKHGQCQAPGCGHRTPIFTTPVVAIKELSTFYIELTCPSCNHTFHAELGETRMAPDAELVILESEPSFTEMSQSFAQLLKDYSQGASDEKRKRVQKLSELVEHEPGLFCPICSAFAGSQVKAVIDRHSKAQRISDLRKTDFEIERYRVAMTLLIHSDWLQGSPGFDKQGNELGGYAGAGAESTAEWYQQRLEKLQLIEVRGRVTRTKLQADGTIKEETGLPDEITLSDGSAIHTGRGTVPERSTFICSACGRQEDILDATRPTGHTPPTAVYLLQCYSKQRDMDGYNYNGRYFKAPDARDYSYLINSDKEWETRSQSDLSAYWPREELFVSYMTHRLNGGIPNWGYTHWWKMFNSRQLLVHTQLLRSIMCSSNGSLDMLVREQALYS